MCKTEKFDLSPPSHNRDTSFLIQETNLKSFKTLLFSAFVFIFRLVYLILFLRLLKYNRLISVLSSCRFLIRFFFEQTQIIILTMWLYKIKDISEKHVFKKIKSGKLKYRIRKNTRNIFFFVINLIISSISLFILFYPLLSNYFFCKKWFFVQTFLVVHLEKESMKKKYSGVTNEIAIIFWFSFYSCFCLSLSTVFEFFFDHVCFSLLAPNNLQS